MSLAVRHKVVLSDYELTTTLGTGKQNHPFVWGKSRLFWTCDVGQAQEDRRVLRDEAFEKGRHYQVTTGRSCNLREQHPLKYWSPLLGKQTKLVSLTACVRSAWRDLLRMRGTCTFWCRTSLVANCSHICARRENWPKSTLCKYLSQLSSLLLTTGSIPRKWPLCLSIYIHKTSSTEIWSQRTFSSTRTATWSWQISALLSTARPELTHCAERPSIWRRKCFWIRDTESQSTGGPWAFWPMRWLLVSTPSMTTTLWLFIRRSSKAK